MFKARGFAAGIAGLVLSLLAGVAAARDYIVVASTDPAISRGRALDAGERVALAPGATLTLMHASGDLLTLKGAAAGVVLPRRVANQGEADRMAILRVIVAPAEGQPVGGRRGVQTRGGVCPPLSSLNDLDAIVTVHLNGCRGEAAAALRAWIDAHPPS